MPQLQKQMRKFTRDSVVNQVRTRKFNPILPPGLELVCASTIYNESNHLSRIETVTKRKEK